MRAGGRSCGRALWRWPGALARQVQVCQRVLAGCLGLSHAVVQSQALARRVLAGCPERSHALVQPRALAPSRAGACLRHGQHGAPQARPPDLHLTVEGLACLDVLEVGQVVLEDPYNFFFGGLCLKYRVQGCK